MLRDKFGIKSQVPNYKSVIEQNTGIKCGKLVVTPNTAQTINNIKYSGHALDRMQQRGITHSVIENTIKTIQPIRGKEVGTIVYYDTKNNLTVIQNEITKQVITLSKGKIKQ